MQQERQMNDDSEDLAFLPDPALRQRLFALRQQHQDIEAAITALEEAPVVDQLRIARFKKQKLLLRDEIVALEGRLKPDIIA